MRKYRILSNGVNYRIQWFGKTFFLKRPKWYWFRKYAYDGDYIAEFSSVMAARDAITKSISQDNAEKQGYIPIDN